MIAAPVLELCRSVSRAGGRAMLVGGWVRDLLRGCPKTDYDLEVYHLPAAELLELLSRLGRVNPVGEAYTVYKVRLRGMPMVVDVSLPRRESKVSRGHRGFVVTGDPEMSFAEAARRRDFTINAIMHDPLTGEFIDPHGGREDLEKHRLRVVDPATFVEDSLRVLRAMQFAARLDFTIDPGTISLCQSIDLHDLPAERIWGEVEKWLLHAVRPSIGLHAARELGVTRQLWPEIEPLDPARLGAALDAAAELLSDLNFPRRVTVMLATLCRDFTQGGPAVERFLERLQIHTFENYQTRRQILALVAHRGLPVAWAAAPVPDGEYRRLAMRVEPGLLARVERASSPGQEALVDPFTERVHRLGVEIDPPVPLLQGRHLLSLGLTPGPRIGEVTRAIYQLQLDDQVLTLEEAIAAARHHLSSQS
jgi:tRNA nucleotidyltransferase (CCA-adding enzyme)